jgi:hypothetical protein
MFLSVNGTAQPASRFVWVRRRDSEATDKSSAGEGRGVAHRADVLQDERVRLNEATKPLLWTLLAVAAASVVGWALAGLYGWAVVMLVGAALLMYLGLRGSSPRRSVPANLERELVGVGFVPNAPLVEVVVAQLRSNGIAAMYRSAQPFGGANPVTNPEGYCEVLVHRADALRARPFVAGSS